MNIINYNYTVASISKVVAQHQNDWIRIIDFYILPLSDKTQHLTFKVLCADLCK